MDPTFQNGKILYSNFKLDKTPDTIFFIFLGFIFQTTFLRFIFQTCRDSGFKFEIDGIQDSDLGLQGPYNPLMCKSMDLDSNQDS